MRISSEVTNDAPRFVWQSPMNKSISTAMLKQVLSRRRWQVSHVDDTYPVNGNVMLIKKDFRE